MPIAVESAVQWKEMLSLPVVKQVMAEAESRTPRAFSPGDPKSFEIAAQHAAYAQGYKDALEMLVTIANERPGKPDSEFMDMSAKP